MRILVVEDERDLNRIICKRLAAAGYSTDACYDGREALDYLEAAVYDAAVFDVMMPRMDGFEAVRRLRERGDATPVLFLTARDAVGDRVAGLDLGANDYLVKPFSFDELLARIRAMTRSPLAKEPNRLSMGNVSLDLASYELSTPAGSFRLTSKEFQMMEMLLANPRRLIPTERFLEKIWGYDTEAEIHVVWVYISYLRKKLASLQANVQIRVARNAGYSLEEIP